MEIDDVKPVMQVPDFVLRQLRSEAANYIDPTDYRAVHLQNMVQRAEKGMLSINELARLQERYASAPVLTTETFFWPADNFKRNF